MCAQVQLLWTVEWRSRRTRLQHHTFNTQQCWRKQPQSWRAPAPPAQVSRERDELHANWSLNHGLMCSSWLLQDVSACHTSTVRFIHNSWPFLSKSSDFIEPGENVLVPATCAQMFCVLVFWGLKMFYMNCITYDWLFILSRSRLFLLFYIHSWANFLKHHWLSNWVYRHTGFVIMLHSPLKSPKYLLTLSSVQDQYCVF